ncbi:heme exporter protein CcmB [Aquabacterium humicola]|uniref:heme exporter protein CcmB n=1 Tax=Aquabacterium humicola TaxID=3237377 RepID=UPI0032EC5E04
MRTAVPALPAESLAGDAMPADEVDDELGFAALLQRDLLLASRRRIDIVLPLTFFVIATSLFPLGVGPEAAVLRQMAAGVLWVAALLAAMLSVATLYASDAADGSLEQMLLAPRSGFALAAAKAMAHWCVTGVPLLLAAPVIGLVFGLDAAALGVLVASLALGTPVLSLLGGLGAALTLGLRAGGMLLVLLILPLLTPVLVFGAAAVAAAQDGLSAAAHLSLLGAFALFSAVLAPWATAHALRIAME